LVPEITKTMNRLGISADSFFFKVLTPIYPPTKAKIFDKEYWEKNKWTFKGENKAESEINDVLDPMLYQFQKQAIFRKEALKQEVGPDVAESPLFDTNYKFIRSQAFEDANFEPDLKIDAKMWLRELFMQCQLNATHQMFKT